MTTVYYNGTREDLKRLIYSLPQLFAGLGVDVSNVAQSAQLAAGMALLSKIHQDFETKSRGGTGEDGVKWKHLAPATIEARLRKAGLTTRNRAFRRVRDALKNVDEATGKGRREVARAERMLEKVLAPVDILRDTGLMFRSFSPGVFDITNMGPQAEYQVIDVLPGRVIVGTNRYPVHHEGSQDGRIPARPLWPLDGNLPESWWEAILDASVGAVVWSLIVALGGQPPPDPPVQPVNSAA